MALVSGLGNRRSPAPSSHAARSSNSRSGDQDVKVADYTPINNPDGYGLNVKIQFRPSQANMRKLADQIAFIQTVRRSSGGRPAGRPTPSIRTPPGG